MQNIKAVVFDMDGTLLDTLTDLKLALNYSLSCFGYEERSTDEVRNFLGAGMDALISLALPDRLKLGADEDEGKRAELERIHKQVKDRFIEYYIDHGEDNTKPYPQIMSLLHALKARGIKVAVVSNKALEAVKRLNERLFADVFDAEIGDVQGIKLKPAPDMILSALDELGVEKEATVYVGDGDTDIMAAKNAGVRCISVTYGYRSEEFLRAHCGKEFADSVDALAELLGVELD